MKSSLKTYKRRFDQELKHIKIILNTQRQNLPANAWLDLVRETRDAILREPEFFFGNDLPRRTILCEAIDSVFEGFLKDQRLRAIQTGKGFKMPVWPKSK